jgi:imidazolonepropionase-like amidohydrolase
MSAVIFENANVLDTKSGTILGDHHVLVSDGRIAEVSDTRINASAARRVDVKGRTLMPGLCDGHVHVTAITANFPQLLRESPFYVAAQAGHILHAMLMRGFTTVRDAGGADHGLAKAVAEDLLPGPRLLYAGKSLSQTGGHGDMRQPGEGRVDDCFCCAGLGRICDGIAEVQRAARDEIRKGATQIKIMASGGVSSPTDRVDSTQFSVDEVSAIVAEAEAANIYTMAHAYDSRAISRLLKLGVRTIEHGNLLDEANCAEFVEHDAYLVPTLSTYQAIATEGLEAGMASELQAKVHDVLDAGAKAVELAYNNGVKMIYGTDLLGTSHRHQLNEFSLRSRVVPAADLIRSATCMAAEAFMAEGDFGVICAGARADLLIVDGNPLDDISVLQEPERNLVAIMKGGRFYKNNLA